MCRPPADTSRTTADEVVPGRLTAATEGTRNKVDRRTSARLGTAIGVFLLIPSPIFKVRHRRVCDLRTSSTYVSSVLFDHLSAGSFIFHMAMQTPNVSPATLSVAPWGQPLGCDGGRRSPSSDGSESRF